MRVLVCVMLALASASWSARAQTFVNLGFEDAHVSEGEATWKTGVPGWGRSETEDPDYLNYLFPHLGFSQIYVLLPADRLFGAAAGSFALGIRSGTFFEHEPRGDVVQAFLSQTGTLGTDVRSVRLLTSDYWFSLTLNGYGIQMIPVGLDRASTTYAEDVMTYRGEWTGNVSAFAGQVVELKISDESFRVGGGQSWQWPGVIVDEIRFLPVPELSTTALLGPGLLAVLLGVVLSKRTERSLLGLIACGTGCYARPCALAPRLDT